MPIIPARPPRPTVPTASYTQVLTGTPTASVAAGTVIYGQAIDTPGGPPGSRYNPQYGSPLVHVSHEFMFDWTLNNAGMIWNYSTVHSVTAVWADQVVNSGWIVAETAIPDSGPGYTPIAYAYGVVLLGRLAGASLDPGGLINSGNIHAIGTASNAITVYSESIRQTFLNSGVIAAEASYGADTQVSGGANAIRLTNGGYVVNQAGASILAEGPYARAVFFGRGEHPAFDFGPQLSNAGLIEAVSTDPGQRSIAVTLTNNFVEHIAVENSGTIRADVAIYAPSSPAETFTSAWQVNIQTIRNLAGGVIDGDIELHLGADTLINRGTIIGTIRMGDGNDVFDSAGGVIDGVADLGFGNDGFIGGSGLDAVMGQSGNDTIDGGGGNDLLIGGYGDDVLTGGTGNDGLYGEAGNDRFVLAGGDVANGGTGDDRFEAGDYAFGRIDGENGGDTWALAAGSRALNLSAVVSSGRVTGIERIELNGGKILALAAADVAGISGGDLLTIDAEASDEVRLIGSWAAGAQESVGGVTYTRYISGSAAVLIEAGATVVLGGSASGTSGLDAVAGGGTAPLPGSVAGAVLQNAITVAQHIAFQDLTIGADEAWISPNGGVVLSAQSDSVDIVNHGSISSRGDTINGLGTAIAFGPASDFDPQNMASFTNTGIVLADAPGLAIAFFSGGRGRLINSGDIHAFSGSGDATAAVVYDAPIFGYAAVNQAGGDIFAASQTGFATGISFGNTGSLHNQGVIEAQGGDGAVAVDMWNAGGVLLNDGDIIAYAPPSSSSYAIATYFSLRADVTNTGTIAADIAIYIDARYGYESRITNTGDIYGAIAFTPMDENARYDRLTIANSGRIFGDIIILVDGLAADTIVNTGLIDGLVDLGGGNDVFDGSAGTQSGWISGQGGNDRLTGGTGSDRLDGGDGDDWLDLSLGGADQARGGAGNDAFFFGAAFTAADAVDGGAGSNDQLGLQGNYTGGTALNLGVGNVTGVEVITLLSGAGNAYAIVTADDMVADGGVATFFGTNLAAGNGFSFDGSAETNGAFRIYGGAGIDLITTGAGSDGIWFGPDRFDPATDRVNGGAGVDQLALDGVYDLILDSGIIRNIEVLTLQAGAGNSFTLTALDNFVDAGATKTIWGLPVAVGISIDLRAESDGHYRVFGGRGNDSIIGGAGNDWMFGGEGADLLAGAGGADTFYYDAVSQSTGAAFDTIVGYDPASDRIDLPFALSGIAATVTGGSVSMGSFDADLAALLGGGQLGVGQALLFTADAGGLAGNSFLVVDANNVAGYQAGEDYVIRLLNPPDELRPEAFV